MSNQNFTGLRAIGSHHSAVPMTTTWLTPPNVIEALGGAHSFDLDPCAAPAPRPWDTALRMNAEADGDGLAIDWYGRVWLNPPYTASEIPAWMKRLTDHGRGTALIFARTETAMFQREVWDRASGLLFLFGRLNFHDRAGVRSMKNAGAPSVLCAYGQDDLDRLAASDLAGALVPLRFARFVLVEGLTQTWSEVMTAWLAGRDGEFSVSDAYRAFARHPKARSNSNWQAKVRQKLQEHAQRVSPGIYRTAQADLFA